MQVKKAYLEHINNNEPGDFVPEDVEFEELIARPHATTKVLQAYVSPHRSFLVIHVSSLCPRLEPLPIRGTVCRSVSYCVVLRVWDIVEARYCVIFVSMCLSYSAFEVSSIRGTDSLNVRTVYPHL